MESEASEEMVLQQQLHTVDSVWDLLQTPRVGRKRFYIINGELFEMSPVKRQHARLASVINFFLQGYVMSKNLGEVQIEVGCHPPGDRSTLLAPDVAFVSQARLSQLPEDEFIPLMPDLAVEVVSPSNSIQQIRRKASIYLDNGSRLVWIVLPAEKGVDVCRAADGARLDIEFVPADGTVSGEDVLPGFTLELSRLFPNPEPQ